MLIVYLSFVYILIFLLLIIFSPKLSLKKNHTIFLFFLFIISLVTIALNVNPPQNWDLYRHYVYLNEIRTSGIPLWDFLFNNANNIGNPSYKYLLFFNVLRWIVAQTGLNVLLPAVAIAVDYTIVSYIIIDYAKYDFKNINIFSILICLALLPFLYVLSGIRNGAAACIEALAVYLYLYKDDKKTVFFVLSLIAVTIHYAAIIVIPLVLVSKYRFNYKTVILIIVSSFSLSFVARIMLNSSIVIFRSVAKTYLNYSSSDQYWGSDKVLFVAYALIVLVVICFFRAKKHIYCKNVLNKDYPIYNFILYYSIFILTNIGNYDLILRPAYVLGALSPVAASFLVPSVKENKINKVVSWLIIFAAAAFCLALNYSYIKSLLQALT